MYACVFGGSANGDLFSSTGEYTVVASANRGVRGTLSEDVDDESSDEEVDVLDGANGAGRLLPVGGAT
jgi:hypothetical protein